MRKKSVHAALLGLCAAFSRLHLVPHPWTGAFRCLLPEKYKTSQISRPAQLLFLFLLHPNTSSTTQVTSQINASGGLQDAVNYLFLRFPPQIVKISSKDINNIYPTQSLPRSAHLSVDLDFSTAIESISSSSPLTAATISAQDFPVFTTDTQSTWLPNSPSALPAPSAHQLQSPVENQQDFVLFDNPQPRQVPNRSSVTLSSQRRHSNHNRRDRLVSSAVHNPRVAQIIQAIGHQSSSSVIANRFANQFYASSAPSSSVSLSSPQKLQQHQQGSVRPPVPLFNQRIGSVHQSAKMMNAADVDLDEFTAFEGGASTAFSSPAPSVMDFSGSMSSSTSNLGTVSPQDLLVQDPFMSAPNSSALTALTSPSIYNESPDFDGFDVSPNFGSADFETSSDPWYPLFPQDSGHSGPEVNLEDSPAQKSDDIDSVGRVSGSGNRKKATNSPISSGRHSSVAGVSSRKRDKPLPPIIVEDPHDTVAMKRARNTLAARKSRERKAQRLDELEDRIAKLEAERDHWKKIALSQSGAQT
ncbi:General control protein [Metarhizium acridum]|uniref:General control protein n=1 Tax=Metarhizium acridum TaxID=92637 RepID=UPI001C6B46F8|nr:General control protein [Metarhizium acridum]